MLDIYSGLDDLVNRLNVPSVDTASQYWVWQYFWTLDQTGVFRDVSRDEVRRCIRGL